MAMATAVASTSFTSLKSVTFGAGVQGLRVANQKVSAVRLGAIPSVSAKLSTSSDEVSQHQIAGTTLAGAMFAALAMSDPAMASQQLITLAEGDNRGLFLLAPLVPAIGWVLFNILQPALNQVNKMRSAKALVAGAGLSALATLVAAPHADAAQEIAQLADTDSRGLILLSVLTPAIGWVLFNILQPALNQINKMRIQKGVVSAVGLGAASMLITAHADAAQEIATIADSDTRGLILLGILLPAIGWVLFNILQPALNQINKMRGPSSKGPNPINKMRGVQRKGLNQMNKMRGGSRRGLIGAAGLSAAAASLLAVPQAEAQVQEFVELAADSRPLIFLFILAPAVGWVLFNILQPTLNQINKMRTGNKVRIGSKK